MAPKQLRLFKVVTPTYQDPQYFQSKAAAKEERASLKPAHLVVMRGPDHWRGESFNKSTRMRGARSNW